MSNIIYRSLIILHYVGIFLEETLARGTYVRPVGYKHVVADATTLALFGDAARH